MTNFNPLEQIQQNFASFTKTEQNIGAFILNNPKNFARSSIEQNVIDTKSSKSAMIRFAKKLGYNGYTEFKYELSRLLITYNFNEPDKEITEFDSIQKVTSNYCKFIEQINDTVKIDEVKELVHTILQANKSIVFAVNRTSLSALQLQMRALKIGLNIQTIKDSIMMTDMANTMGKDDFALIFTIRDNGKIYQSKIEAMIERGCKIGLVTMTPNLPYANKCSQVITLPSVSNGYAKFIDEQVIYFVFVEILLTELATALRN